MPAVTKNIADDYGAVGDGVTNDYQAFADFRSFAQTWQTENTGIIRLNIPEGFDCLISFPGATTNGQLFRFIESLEVVGLGAGATLSGSYFLGGSTNSVGSIGGNAQQAGVQTVAAGSRKLILINSSLSSLYTIGKWALLAGVDLQGFGSPINPHFFQFVKILDVSGDTIIIHEPLKDDYKSTWPNYNATLSQFEPYLGGPATLYPLSDFETEIVFSNLTYDSGGTGEIYGRGKSITHDGCTSASGIAVLPSFNKEWKAFNHTSTRTIEVDKCVENLVIQGGSWASIDVQSSSIRNMVIDGADVSGFIKGTPRRAIIRQTSAASFTPGPYNYGASEEVVLDTCAITAFNLINFTYAGVSEGGVNLTTTITDGVIRITKSVNVAPIAVPGRRLSWKSAYESEGMIQVTDVTEDGTYIYLHTDWNDDFPPSYAGNGKVNLATHPAPRFTCISCTGDAQFESLNQHPAGRPLYSYGKATYNPTGSGTVSPSLRTWGKLGTITANVTDAYAGSGSATMYLAGQFINPMMLADFSDDYDYRGLIDLKTAGTRTITPAGVSGSGGADANLTPGPSAQALWQPLPATAFVNHNVSSDATEVVITWDLDQGFDETDTVPAYRLAVAAF